MEPWQYRARLKALEDGDTFYMEIDLGFEVILTSDEAIVRLYHIDTAETNEDSDEDSPGIRQKRFVEEWFNNAGDEEWQLLIKTKKDDRTGSFGRWLAIIQRKNDGALLHEALLDKEDESVRYEG